MSGNRQVAAPGEVLPAPLVVRLEDQFGNPLVGVAITAEIIEGEGEFVPAPGSQVSAGSARNEETDAQGVARFFDCG